VMIDSRLVSGLASPCAGRQSTPALSFGMLAKISRKQACGRRQNGLPQLASCDWCANKPGKSCWPGEKASVHICYARFLVLGPLRAAHLEALRADLNRFRTNGNCELSGLGCRPTQPQYRVVEGSYNARRNTSPCALNDNQTHDLKYIFKMWSATFLEEFEVCHNVRLFAKPRQSRFG